MLKDGSLLRKYILLWAFLYSCLVLLIQASFLSSHSPRYLLVSPTSTSSAPNRTGLSLGPARPEVNDQFFSLWSVELQVVDGVQILSDEKI